MSEYKSKAELRREIARLEEVRDAYNKDATATISRLQEFTGQVADALGVRQNYEYEATEYSFGHEFKVTKFDAERLRRDVEYLANKNANDIRVKALGKAIQKAAES